MPKHYPQLHDARWLTKAYATRTVRDIAEEVGCRSSAVTAAMFRHGIAARPTGRPRADVRILDKDFMARAYEVYNTWQIATLLNCHQVTIWKALQRHGIELRSRGRREFVPGKYKQKLPKTPGGTTKEHRQVMEAILGRPLAPDEVVHHKDNDGLNNDPSNLEVMSKAEHHRLHGAEIKLCTRCGEQFRGAPKTCYACHKGHRKFPTKAT